MYAARQGRRDESRRALAAVYGAFTGGFTRPDVVGAAAQLNGLADPRRAPPKNRSDANLLAFLGDRLGPEAVSLLSRGGRR